MAKECPMRKSQAFQFRQSQTYRLLQNRQQNWRTTICKFNQPKKHNYSSKPTKLGQLSQTYTRTAHIEEMDDDDDEDEDVSTMATHAS
jgi:hypothetical protein